MNPGVITPWKTVFFTIVTALRGWVRTAGGSVIFINNLKFNILMKASPFQRGECGLNLPCCRAVLGSFREADFREWRNFNQWPRVTLQGFFKYRVL